MKNTLPIFIIGSGRCGTATMHKIFSQFDNVESHHEYNCELMQILGFEYYLSLESLEEVVEDLQRTIARSVQLSTADYWIDSSNKMSWLMKPLKIVFPNARFVHLARDGRKVVSSYYNKLKDEIYPNDATDTMYKFLTSEELSPPIEKKYWWPWYDDFEKFHRTETQFSRICWHWNEINQRIMNGVPFRDYFVKLEQLASTDDGLEIEKLLGYIGLEVTNSQLYDIILMLNKPHNVSEPKDYPLTEAQDKIFMDRCYDTMLELGYNPNKKVYNVQY